MSRIETIVLVVPEVRIYAIPPLRTNKGYKATDWDVENPIWKGRLKVVEYEDPQSKFQCELVLEDTSTGELFAAAPYSADGKGVDPVTDSSRFFVIRVVSGDQRAILGMGFIDRSEAFDFNVALQDFRKHGRAETDLEKLGNSKDFSLKEGQSISVSIGSSEKSSSSDTKVSSKEPEFIPTLLPPPPLARPNSTSQSTESREDPFDDDFDDFVG